MYCSYIQSFFSQFLLLSQICEIYWDSIFLDSCCFPNLRLPSHHWKNTHAKIGKYIPTWKNFYFVSQYPIFPLRDGDQWKPQFSFCEFFMFFIPPTSELQVFLCYITPLMPKGMYSREHYHKFLSEQFRVLVESNIVKHCSNVIVYKSVWTCKYCNYIFMCRLGLASLSRTCLVDWWCE